MDIVTWCDDSDARCGLTQCGIKSEILDDSKPGSLDTLLTPCKGIHSHRSIDLTNLVSRPPHFSVASPDCFTTVRPIHCVTSLLITTDFTHLCQRQRTVIFVKAYGVTEYA